MPRPAPLRLESLSCTVVRGPRQDGRWYWRARRADATLWTGWATREEASAACARLTLGEQPQGGVCTVGELVGHWFAEAEDRAESGQLAQTSLDTLRAVVRALRRDLGAVRVDAITVSTLERYRDARLRPAPPPRREEGQRGRLPRRGGLASETVARELRLLRQVWTWAHERGLVPSPTLPRVAMRVRAEVERYTPSPAEVAAVLDHLDGWAWLAVRLLWATGCRLGEIASLRRRDVDASRALLRVRGKTGPREVAILPSVLAELLPHLPDEPDARLLAEVTTETIRTSLRRHLAAACKAAKVPRWTAHGLRRLATDALFDAGADPGVEGAQIGHSPKVALTHYRRASVSARHQAVAAARLGVVPTAPDAEQEEQGELVLLGVASQATTERAILDAARRGDLAEVVRLASLLNGTATTQTSLKRRV